MAVLYRRNRGNSVVELNIYKCLRRQRDLKSTYKVFFNNILLILRHSLTIHLSYKVKDCQLWPPAIVFIRIFFFGFQKLFPVLTNIFPFYYLLLSLGIVQLRCDGTRWRTGGEVKGKLANGLGSQYSSHYLGTWCMQHYYRWCAQLGGR